MTHDALNQAPLDTLIADCTQETEQFFRRQAHDEAPCLELMRRALVERNERAWEHLYRQYTPLVASWIQDHPQFAHCTEDVAYFSNEAFQRFWRACTANNFDRFAGLRPLLAYLKACVHSAITDHLRVRETQLQHAPLDLDADNFAQTDPRPRVEDQIIDQDVQHLFWTMIQQRLQHEQEQAVIYYQFVQGWKPREIYARRGDLFTNQQEVYRVRDNLIRRLSRDPELRAFFAESRII